MASDTVSNGFFLIEIDGVSVIEATEFDLGDVKHEPTKTWVGTRASPIIGRGKHEYGEVKLKQAYAINNEGNELFGLFYDFIHGLSTTCPDIRVVQLNDDGFTVYRTHQFTKCVPTTWKTDGKKAEGKESAMFEIAFKPNGYEEI